ncbi:MAG TPA: fumarylacetoacetate hydrolase family protein [Chryseosolibacter sp.]|nr:fumarylacetoacetate hydrolase family protein [Chryseosolibacter sp.]
MKLYKTRSGIVIRNDGGSLFSAPGTWDEFINDDGLYLKMKRITESAIPLNKDDLLSNGQLLAPIGSQEIWAAGVTYYRSKVGRQEESKDSGGGDFYARVYEAERPEIFFKNSAHRAVGPYDKVRIRKDSAWNVPEPELTLVITSGGRIIGYTIGNDMSSRSIEGENPLYLPQAKCYDKSASIGPCIMVTDKPLDAATTIRIGIRRAGAVVFDGQIQVSQIKRKLEELVMWLFKETSFPHGCMLMTGTGIVPPNDFTLASGDEIEISVDGIGTLVNTVE